jgi:hypothetical protein
MGRIGWLGRQPVGVNQVLDSSCFQVDFEVDLLADQIIWLSCKLNIPVFTLNVEVSASFEGSGSSFRHVRVESDIFCDSTDGKVC